jgi:hypothetical protein
MGTITEEALSRMFTVTKCSFLGFRNFNFLGSKTNSLVRTITEWLVCGLST